MAASRSCFSFSRIVSETVAVYATFWPWKVPVCWLVKTFGAGSLALSPSFFSASFFLSSGFDSWTAATGLEQARTRNNVANAKGIIWLRQGERGAKDSVVGGGAPTDFRLRRGTRAGRPRA